MNGRSELKWLVGLSAVFLALYFLPVGTTRFDGAVLESFQLAKWYTREHVLLCLVPAMLVLRRFMGWQRPIVYESLVVVMATATGLFYGWLAA